MAKITQLKKGNENVYPLVHMDGVVDDNGNSISTMWDTKQETLVSGSNIKTVNGTSLLGSGDIEVVSVDAGDINVLQSTGDSQVDVMSQKAVTEYGRKVTDEDLNGTSDWIKARLTEEGWALGKRLVYNSLYDASTRCVTPFISYAFRAGEVITFHYAHEAETNQSMVILYSSDEVSQVVQYENSAEEINITVKGSDKVKFKFTLDIAKISECYVYNKTREEYVWKGDEYLANLIAQYDSNLTYKGYHDGILAQDFGGSTLKTMSQKAITNAFEADIYINRPTYLNGRLTYFSLEDYPDLDLRTADGISVVFTTNSKDSERTPMFDIWNPNNGGNGGMANRHFGLWNWDGNISFGFFSSYGAITTGGYSFSRVTGHYVITYDFKTGICKCYKNGVLVTTSSPTTWDEQTMVRDYFNTCTHIHLCSLDDSVGHKSTGIAVYSNVLTDEDVASIYGGGKESIKSILTPEIYKANYAHPILSTNWGIRTVSETVTPITGGGYTINAVPSSDYIRFGFTGLEGLINNLIYEWDFEVTSGSSTHNSSINYSRAMRIGGGYSKCFVIYDSNGNNVTFDTLGIGTYHVVSRPDNIKAGGINTDYNVYPYVYLDYFFLCSSDFSMTISPTLKLTERGAAIECSIRNYRGTHWELPGGIKLPLDYSNIYETSKFILGTDTFVEDTVIYAANNPPQFNGQMAVDTTKGRIYVGYLTGTGGTWKQINNS